MNWRWHFESPDRRRRLYVYRNIRCENEYFLLDFSKESCRRLDISYRHFSDICWSEDSRILGITFPITTNFVAVFEFYLYDCDNEILCLRWVYQNNYCVCVDVRNDSESARLLHFYNMCISPNGVIMRLLFKVEFADYSQHE